MDGLALIGTQAEVQVSASPEQLQKTIDALRTKCSSSCFDGVLTFVIGENGFDLALKLGLPASHILKVGNWCFNLQITSYWSSCKSRVSVACLCNFCSWSSNITMHSKFLLGNRVSLPVLFLNVEVVQHWKRK